MRAIDKDETPEQPLTLRDRKKAKLRETAIEVARRLFETQGYEQTTLEQVCDEAEISLRTLLRYFPTKEDLALAREAAGLEQFSNALAKLDKDKSGINFWRNFVVERASHTDPAYVLARYRLIDQSPAVYAKMLTINLKFEDVLSQRFSKEAGLDPKTDLYSQILAGVLIAGNRRIAQRWRETHGKLDLARQMGDLVDWVIKHYPSRGRAGSLTPKRKKR